jgi:hypothetical protein
MKGKKNDFSMTFYHDQERILFLEYVHDTNKALKWVENNGFGHYTHYVTYNRRTRERLERVVK